MKMIDIHGHMGMTSSGQPIDVDGLVKSMDEFGISITGISSLSGVVTKAQNDLVYECRKRYPTRVKAYAFINPKAPDVHDEIDKRLGDQNFDGVKFHAWKHGFVSDNTSQLDKVLDHIQNYGVMVQTHVGTSPLATPYAWIRYAQKKPKLRMVFTHMGCREFAFSVLKAVPEVKNIYLETSVIYDRDVLENVREAVGAKRVTFGSDWPYKSVEVEIAKVYKMKFTDNELEDVFFNNAKELLERK